MSIAEKLTLIAENEQKVYDAGKKAEYDAFWDTLQNNGQPMNYNYLFSMGGWNDDIYNPKYPINCSTAVAIFNSNEFITDTKVPIIANDVYLNQTFTASKLQIIQELQVNENTTYNHAFSYQTTLEELAITGTIAKNGFDVSPCINLNKASITNIINALSDSTSGLTVTISNTAKVNAFTDDEWATLIATKPNWTISLL